MSIENERRRLHQDEHVIREELRVIEILKEEVAILETEVKILKKANRILAEENFRLKHQHITWKPIFDLSFTINKQVYIMANVGLVIGSPKSGAFTLIDNKTLLPIDGVTYFNQAVGANSNPEFATFSLDANNPNSVVATPLAAGSGTVVITTDASYTDPGDGSARQDSFTVTKTFVVSPSADGATFDVVFP